MFPGDLTLDCSILRANVFIVKNLVCIDDKKHSDRKNFEIASIINTNIYTSTLEICRDRDNSGSKNIESRLLGKSDFVAVKARYHSACSLQNSAIRVLKTHFSKNHQEFVQYKQIK